MCVYCLAQILPTRGDPKWHRSHLLCGSATSVLSLASFSQAQPTANRGPCWEALRLRPMTPRSLCPLCRLHPCASDTSLGPTSPASSSCRSSRPSNPACLLGPQGPSILSASLSIRNQNSMPHLPAAPYGWPRCGSLHILNLHPGQTYSIPSLWLAN